MLRRSVLPLAWLAGVLVLGVAGPSPGDLTRLDGLGERLASAPESALYQLAAAASWLVLLWLAVAWLAVWGGRARGRAGHLSRGLAAVLVPRVLKGVLEGGVGLSVVLSAAPALAATQAPSVASPVSLPIAASSAAELPGSLPSLDRQPATDVQLTPLPAVPAPDLAPAIPARADPTTRGSLPPEADEVVVRRGDCLWSVVARALGPEVTDAEVARAWPRWYAANRAVIGDDPGLLLPGQRLTAPDHFR